MAPEQRKCTGYSQSLQVSTILFWVNKAGITLSEAFGLVTLNDILKSADLIGEHRWDSTLSRNVSLVPSTGQKCQIIICY